MRGRLEVRRAHGQVDDLAAGSLQLGASGVERGEHLVAKSVESLGELHGETSVVAWARRMARVRTRSDCTPREFGAQPARLVERLEQGLAAGTDVTVGVVEVARPPRVGHVTDRAVAKAGSGAKR